MKSIIFLFMLVFANILLSAPIDSVYYNNKLLLKNKTTIIGRINKQDENYILLEQSNKELITIEKNDILILIDLIEIRKKNINLDSLEKSALKSAFYKNDSLMKSENIGYKIFNIIPENSFLLGLGTNYIVPNVYSLMMSLFYKSIGLRVAVGVEDNLYNYKNYYQYNLSYNLYRDTTWKHNISAHYVFRENYRYWNIFYKRDILLSKYGIAYDFSYKNFFLELQFSFANNGKSDYKENLLMIIPNIGYVKYF